MAVISRQRGGSRRLRAWRLLSYCYAATFKVSSFPLEQIVEQIRSMSHIFAVGS